MLFNVSEFTFSRFILYSGYSILAHVYQRCASYSC